MTTTDELEPDLRVVQVTDERTPLARAAIDLIGESIAEVQAARDLLSELEEARLGFPSGGDFHLLAMIDGDGDFDVPVAAAAGVYLESVNAGYVGYLAVRRDQRGLLLGSKLRDHLIEAFEADARRLRGEELAWAVGEVRRRNPWLQALVRDGTAVPLDLQYFHPWQTREPERVYVLYRELLADTRLALPAEEVAHLLYAIWRRAYRIRYPMQNDVFRFMIDQAAEKGVVGPDPVYALEEGED